MKWVKCSYCMSHGYRVPRFPTRQLEEISHCILGMFFWIFFFFFLLPPCSSFSSAAKSVKTRNRIRKEMTKRGVSYRRIRQPADVCEPYELSCRVRFIPCDGRAVNTGSPV
ncbi:hypothetical protein H112_08626 [Trichophyton rubrum D6]|uniref:Uncharacterized protein n=3 Tax=Trichophyton TaxID=5550 RepID=A0A080WQP5_TRIRC|nr:uncharacterized protein TERG_11686 [Trichophyton rubrum CBS 118892]EZF10089.1 hypothetical protein H100_08648 [Trichophyton rubrum MR850]EZF36894.1 hypothetical protein H102_08607 [Trichophyton rubrum CBS 100081]EZF47528.1 hypothetical protein H103_08630 [Trichophyton rubrum CBS 288.86]EZF58186.1 hypothetical protein H104_08582 [Trichophyton rubrum CBS 289.86]EZF68851.1 hypothetical protein H105_08634 [Trichophyton soudanense CBS 452.61]EZF79528.1 hypothetical protein H110_08632 [Trichophy